LTNLEYAVMAEVMGHAIRIAPESMNCSAPDTGQYSLSIVSCLATMMIDVSIDQQETWKF
jgi:hypothetical protein